MNEFGQVDSVFGQWRQAAHELDDSFHKVCLVVRWLARFFVLHDVHERIDILESQLLEISKETRGHLVLNV